MGPVRLKMRTLFSRTPGPHFAAIEAAADAGRPQFITKCSDFDASKHSAQYSASTSDSVSENISPDRDFPDYIIF